MRIDYLPANLISRWAWTKENCDTIYHNNNDLLYSPVGNLRVQYNFWYGLKIYTSRMGGGGFLVYDFKVVRPTCKKKINCIGFYSKLFMGFSFCFI